MISPSDFLACAQRFFLWITGSAIHKKNRIPVVCQAPGRRDRVSNIYHDSTAMPAAAYSRWQGGSLINPEKTKKKKSVVPPAEWKIETLGTKRQKHEQGFVVFLAFRWRLSIQLPQSGTPTPPHRVKTTHHTHHLCAFRVSMVGSFYTPSNPVIARLRMFFVSKQSFC